MGALDYDHSMIKFRENFKKLVQGFICLLSLTISYPTIIQAAAIRVGDKIYAEWNNGLYYRSTVRAVNATQVEAAWEDGSAPTWVDRAKVKPRVGHGLTRAMIGDNPPNAEEQRASDRAREAQMRDRATECAKRHTRLDCMRSFSPCVWESEHCNARPY